MTVYLGTLGRLVELWSTPSQQVQAEERYIVERTLEGVRKAQVKPEGSRTWSLNASYADPSEQGALMQFANGAWGNGPFVFVSAEAPRTNMLTPAGSTSTDAYQSEVSNAGPVLVPEVGWSPQSLTRAGGGEIYAQFERVPVLAGVPVTGSWFVQGAGAMVRLYWTDDSASVIGASNSLAAVGSSMQRLVVTALPPAGATGVRLVAQGAARVTLPSVTWGSSPVAWADGQGCPKAVLSQVSRDVAVTGHNGTFSNLSFTISEVG